MTQYLKAIVSAVIAGLAVLVSVYTQNGQHFTALAIMLSINAALTSLVTVFLVPNKTQPQFVTSVPPNTEALSAQLAAMQTQLDKVTSVPHS